MQARSKSITALLLLLLCVLAGCNINKVYDNFEHTPLTGWEKNDSVAFSIPALEKAGTYQLDLQMRTDNSFPFQSVVLIVEQTVSPGHFIYADTLNCRLANEKGAILGDGINVYQYSFKVNDRHYNVGDSLYITVRHDMKREMLPGISDIGVKLNRIKD